MNTQTSTLNCTLVSCRQEMVRSPTIQLIPFLKNNSEKLALILVNLMICKRFVNAHVKTFWNSEANLFKNNWKFQQHFFLETRLKPWILIQYTVRSWVTREGWQTKWSYVNELVMPKSQLKSTCLTAKFGSFLDHAETGERGQNVISSSVQHPISLILAIHVSFIKPLPMVMARVLLTKPRLCRNLWSTVCLHGSFTTLKNKHMGVLGTNAATMGWLHWSPVLG